MARVEVSEYVAMRADVDLRTYRVLGELEIIVPRGSRSIRTSGLLDSVDLIVDLELEFDMDILHDDLDRLGMLDDSGGYKMVNDIYLPMENLVDYIVCKRP